MIETLNKYYQDGLITKQKHPYYDLYIWNYTPDVQINKLWDDVTLMCRGLVTDGDGNIVARPFKKFFNYGELNPSNIPNIPFDVYEKVDGSLGILFYYGGEWIFASRGSFTSDWAIKGRQILEKSSGNCAHPYYDVLAKSLTYCFEIIFPSGRIVVDYGNVEKLVLLGAIETSTGSEVGYFNLTSIATLIGTDVVKKYDGISDYNQIKETIKDDEEGRVVLFKNGFRMKIKGDEYLRLHFILTQISTRTIWEWAKEGKTLDEMLIDVPDEFYGWARATYDDLISKFNTKKKEVDEEFWTLIDKKEFAAKVKGRPNEHFLFKRLNSYSKQLDDMIWDKLYPDYYRPFSDKTIEDDN